MAGLKPQGLAYSHAASGKQQYGHVYRTILKKTHRIFSDCSLDYYKQFIDLIW
jgi:hypothetical protein